MAKKKKGKGKERKGKKPKKKKAASKVANVYDVSGGSIKRKNHTCPKCGPGIFMAAHKDRATCGKCGFTEKK
ncbi:MAG: 30S ribosomal protein S27ae [Nanoarchaeota archaeon]|nr:30S ribosomal protein S27ae [Nanoarchaeota archaeon]MBU1321579.1 30S ribosomal protein S27ae [Nanoarchaeota archaeon]MBU1598376.1 30S ribosomal protein S27ae [Nanoarchaeota archaeon]MBU2442135.1 30S ribosomal protein S27ae [Nanoarchaeota archaeon]